MSRELGKIKNLLDILVEVLAEALRRDKKLISEPIQRFENGTTAEKGNCIEAIEYITKENPNLLKTALILLSSISTTKLRG